MAALGAEEDVSPALVEFVLTAFVVTGDSGFRICSSGATLLLACADGLGCTDGLASANGLVFSKGLACAKGRVCAEGILSPIKVTSARCRNRRSSTIAPAMTAATITVSSKSRRSLATAQAKHTLPSIRTGVGPWFDCTPQIEQNLAASINQFRNIRQAVIPPV